MYFESSYSIIIVTYYPNSKKISFLEKFNFVIESEVLLNNKIDLIDEEQ